MCVNFFPSAASGRLIVSLIFGTTTCIVKTLQALASNLRTCRKVAGLTQQELALLAELDYKHYQKIENGAWPGLRVDTVERLAKALGLSAWQLLQPSEYDLEQERLATEFTPPPNTM